MTTAPPDLEDHAGDSAERNGRGPAWSAMGSWARGRPGTGGVVFLGVLMVYGSASTQPVGTEMTWRARAGAGLKELLGVAVVLVVVWAWERRANEVTARWWARPGWRCRSWWLCAGAAAGAGVLLALNWVAPTVDRLWRHGPAGTYNQLPGPHSPTMWATAVSLVVCAPVLEELLYRGCLQSWLARRVPPSVALLVATTVFAASHGLGPGAYNSVQLTIVFVSGAVYGWLFHATQSVAPGIAAHMAYNGSIVVGHATGASIAFPAAVIAVGLVGLWALRARQQRLERVGADGRPHLVCCAGAPAPMSAARHPRSPSPPTD